MQQIYAHVKNKDSNKLRGRDGAAQFDRKKENASPERVKVL